MNRYISKKTFMTKGIEKKEITSGVIPGLIFELKYVEKNLAYLENIKTRSVIVVTKDMLNSSLFNKL